MTSRSRRQPRRMPLWSGNDVSALTGRLALVVAAGMVLGGCTGADPAEVSAVADKYTGSANPLSVPITDTQARCRAEAYLESDLSDGALDDVRAGKPPTPRNDRDVEVLAELATVLAECFADGD